MHIFFQHFRPYPRGKYFKPGCMFFCKKQVLFSITELKTNRQINALRSLGVRFFFLRGKHLSVGEQLCIHFHTLDLHWRQRGKTQVRLKVLVVCFVLLCSVRAKHGGKGQLSSKTKLSLASRDGTQLTHALSYSKPFWQLHAKGLKAECCCLCLVGRAGDRGLLASPSAWPPRGAAVPWTAVGRVCCLYWSPGQGQP